MSQEARLPAFNERPQPQEEVRANFYWIVFDVQLEPGQEPERSFLVGNMRLTLALIRRFGGEPVGEVEVIINSIVTTCLDPTGRPFIIVEHTDEYHRQSGR